MHRVVTDSPRAARSSSRHSCMIGRGLLQLKGCGMCTPCLCQAASVAGLPAAGDAVAWFTSLMSFL